MTKALVSRNFCWPGLSQDVRRFIRNCDTYGRKAVWREKRRGLLKPLPIPDRMWSELSIDFIIGLPPADHTNATNLMVITDRLFKSIIVEALVDITTETTAKTLLQCLIKHHGIPRAIVSDRGPQFVNLI